VAEGAFRQDLYYRLNVARICLPPLRQRPEEILPLAGMFLDELAREKRKSFKAISQEAASMLLSYQWPGNVRELKNVMEWVVLMWDDSEVKPSHLGILQKTKVNAVPAETTSASIIDYTDFSLPPGSLPIEEYTNNIIRKALQLHRGNKTETAKYLGISRRSLYCRLKRLRDG
jgi:DNA-binding NtrC family response regulator